MKKSLREKEMYALVEAWQKTGLGQRAFCEQNQIEYYSFQYWTRKYRRQHKQAGAFVPIKLTDQKTPEPNKGTPLPGRSPRVEFIFKDGLTMRIY